jgi:hypothetical protein
LEKFVHELNALWKLSGSSMGALRELVAVAGIDMRTMRKRDVYGQMQRWIITVKDNATGLVYLCALPRKRTAFVAAELEKFFGFVHYPEIFHNGVYTILLTQ